VKLHDYQHRAIAHLHNGGQGLMMDMGLGKTAAVLTALTPEHLPALVFAPKRVAEEVWIEERDLWRPDLSMALAQGTPAQRRKAREERADITVMSRDTVADFGSRKHPYKTVVLDELSGYKTKSTNRWKATRRVTTQADHVWGMTGTPAPNGYHDLWAQIFLLDKGRRLETTLTKYRDRYFNAGRRTRNTNIVIEWILKPGAEQSINRLLSDLCLSMAADDYLELPELTFNVVKIPLPRNVMRMHQDFQDDLTVNLGVLGDVTAANAGVLSNKLRQISAGFLYAEQDTTRWETLHDEKIRATREIIDGTGSPVLVFYQFDAERDALMSAIPEAVSIDEPGIQGRWNRDEIPVLVAHPASTGHGLNLQKGSGHTVVWASLTWSLEEWLQANKRLHRQGQRNNVMVHVLSSPGTTDATVFRALRNKKSVQDALLDYLREDEALL